MCGALHGLHAAHEATSDRGEPLGIVHRDFTPQNVLVGAEGVSRVLDFGVAKAAGRMQTTRDGQLKGKLAYMAPEQLRNGAVDRRTDVFAAGVVLWEALTLRRLFTGDSEGAILTAVFEKRIDPPSALVPGLPADLDEVTLRALDRDSSKRFESARQMALALEASVPLASPTRVAEWVEGLAGEMLAQRARRLADIESDSSSGLTPASLPSEAATRAERAQGSQISTISVSSSGGQEAPHTRTARWVYPAFGFAAVAIGLAVFGVLGSRSSVSSSGSAASGVVPPPPSVLAAPATPSADSTDSSDLAAPSSATSAASTPSAAVIPKPATRRIAAPHAPTPAQPPPCTIKSYFDESGIQHFVRECK
jgi:serine/threonine-protein kinase